MGLHMPMVQAICLYDGKIAPRTSTPTFECMSVIKIIEHILHILPRQRHCKDSVYMKL